MALNHLYEWFITILQQGYKLKPVFFGRKFEAIINQDIINSIDTLLGRDISGDIWCKHILYANRVHPVKVGRFFEHANFYAVKKSSSLAFSSLLIS